MLRTAAPAVLVLASVLALAACGADGPGAAAQEDGLSVVATTTHVADLAREVGGDRASVDSLLTPGNDPHDYEPRPSDARALSGADLVLRSGGEIDQWLGGLIESAGAGAPTVSLLARVRTIEGEGGEDAQGEQGEPDRPESAGVDPHWWQDPRNAMAAVEAIRDAMIAADPEGRDAYAANAAAYLERLRSLDEAIAGCMASIPEEDRKLVTTHDAVGYFAERYDIEVVGLVVPALTTQAQPSAGEVAQLTETIEEEGVRTIFPESQLPAGLEQAIARDSGARVGSGLWTDSLGPEDSPAATYLTAMRSNARAIAEGLGADCSL